ncbi:SRPBCC family protein [Aliirhizobium terrae]|uniref:SRPBCC family protein n=1 Tax=Terrirhizobium terrae TaxID=2926709 RepID=UPI002577014D|nr:SRPBCC family protein [Rhizobium sp. CC-CFT758]WJH39581.1 SRPBCC family protein [Rhizobium sp. CC-CFT758]
MPSTIKLHRVLATSPDKVYRAYVEADALAKWLPPNGFACTVHSFEPSVGGKFRMSFRNFTTSEQHAFGGEFLELQPGERIRYTDRFDDPNLPGEMEVTVILKEVSVGTDMEITQAGIPDLIPAEACYLGWQESLRNLARLVEPNIEE